MGLKKAADNDNLIIADHIFKSRLILGTGKFSSNSIMNESIKSSEAEMVTVALRRVDLDNPDDDILSVIDFDKYIILPNTSGAQNADEAVRLARLARASGISDWVKVEVTPDPRYLLPDGEETLKACRILVTIILNSNCFSLLFLTFTCLTWTQKLLEIRHILTTTCLAMVPVDCVLIFMI